MSTPTPAPTSSEASGSTTEKIKEETPPVAVKTEETPSIEKPKAPASTATTIAPKKDDTSNKAGAEDANEGILTPHDHDVLSGRGNSVNHHPGNEYFRSLVRHHKLAYVRCPKPQKEQFSKLIVSTVRDRDPPGRFLKQNPTTKLWYNIGTQKALDKTRQALREGAPATVAGLMLSQGLTPSAAAAAGLTPSQAVSTLSSVPGETELISNGTSASTNGGSNPFLAHQHAAHHAAAAAVAANQQQQAQQQHHNAMAAAHSRMVNSSYYSAAAAAAAAGYPNSPKPPMPPTTAAVPPKDGASAEAPSANGSKTSGAQPPPQSPKAAAPSYPPLPPPTNSDEAMKYHAVQVVRMAAAAHAATGSGSGASAGSTTSGFGNSAALAAAAGTFNPVLLEHIMAQHRSGGSAPPPGSADWNRQPAPAPRSGEYHTQYPGYSSAPGAPPGQHEDLHAKCQRQEAYIAHLQERLQQQERQLLTLCSHILLSPPNPPPGGAMNPPVPTPASGASTTAAGAAAGGSPLHNGVAHPQYASAAKINAATAVANINATAAAVKEIQSYAGIAAVATVASQSAAASAYAGAPAAIKPKATTPTNDSVAKEKGASSPSTTAAGKSPASAPTPEKATDDGDAVAALLALGIGKSPTSSSPTAAATTPGATDESSKKKRKHSAGGRRTLPLKKKQIQQQETSKAAAAAASTAAAASQQANTTKSKPLEIVPPIQYQSNPYSAIPSSIPIGTRSGAVEPPPEQYLYGETPIHEPHVHVSLLFLFCSFLIEVYFSQTLKITLC